MRGETRQWDASQAYEQAVRLLSFRPRTVHEVRDRLRRRGVPAEIIDDVVARLSESGLLNDEAFAAAWVEERGRSAPRGARLLSAELWRKGVTQDGITGALEMVGDESALALSAGQKKMRALKNEDAASAKRKLIAFLGRRGFNWETVRGVVGTLLPDAPDDEE